MTAEQLHDAIGMLDESILSPTDRLRREGGWKRVLHWRRYLSAAACLAVIIGCALAYRAVGRSTDTTSAEAAVAMEAAPADGGVAAQQDAEEEAAADIAEDAAEDIAEDAAGSTARTAAGTAEPPELTLSGGADQSISAGSYTWTTEAADGTSQTVIACGAAPWEADAEPISLAGDTLSLSWSVGPESVSVLAYTPGQEDGISVACEDGSVTLLEGDYLYAVTAQWPQGEAEYVFRASR